MKTKNEMDYLNDLDQLYDMALGREDFSSALKIKDIQLKHAQKVEKIDVETLSDSQLDTMIKRLELMIDAQGQDF